MPYRRPNSPYWWISYTGADGAQTRRSAGTTVFEEAKAAENRLRAECYDARKTHRPGLGAVDSILAEYLTPRLTPRTRSTARHLAAAFAGRHAATLTAADIRAHIERRRADGAAPATVNKELAMLSAAINDYNARHGCQLANPASGAKLREPEGKLRWLTRDEYTRLLAAASPLVRDFVQLGCHTGLRKGELLQLEWTDVDPVRRLIMLRPEATKSGRRRAVPLNDEALAAIRSRGDACPDSALVFCGVLDLKKGFAGAVRRAGLHDVTPHTLRHTFASWLVIAGVPLYEVRDLLGHSTIKLTERYAHLAPENLRAAVDRIGQNHTDYHTDEKMTKKTAP